MTTVIPGLFQINGVVSTDKSVLQNINAICTAAGCWMTYDITEGKWSVIMNRAGASVASFNDANIIGGINISGKGISELYNSVTIEFPHKDLRDQTDYIDFDIDSAKRFPNELDNKLNLSTDLANDPIQAQYIAGAELKQSRVDKVIQFRTDFSMLGLKAGDLIDVTASMYGYSAKVFRITRLEEDDSDVLQLSITALEYDADVYSTADLNRKIRSKKTGITPKAANATLIAKDSFAVAKQNVEGFPEYLTPTLLASGALAVFLQKFGSVANQSFSSNPDNLTALIALIVSDASFISATGASGLSLSSNASFINALLANNTFVSGLRLPGVAVKTINASVSPVLNSYSGSFVEGNLFDLNCSFSAPYEGTYEVMIFHDFGGTNDGTTIRKKTGIFVSKNGTDITSQLGGTATTFDYTATNDKAADQMNFGKFTATTGDAIVIKAYYQTSAATSHAVTVYGRVTWLGSGSGV